MAGEAQSSTSSQCLKSFGTRPVPEHHVLQGELLEVSISCRDFRRRSSSSAEKDKSSDRRRLGWRVRKIFRGATPTTEPSPASIIVTAAADNNHSHKKLPLPPLNMQDLSDHTASCSSFGSFSSNNDDDFPWDVPSSSMPFLQVIPLDIVDDDSEETVYA